MTTIQDMKVDLFRVPLPTPVEASAAGLMKGFDMVAVCLTDGDGATGMGYTVLHEGQGASVAKIADIPFREVLIGADPDRIEWLWRQMYRRHHYSGRGGPVSFALAAVDVALWDMKGRRLDTPLWRLLGGYDPKVRAYAGNIDLNFPMGRLLEGGSQSVEAGFRSVKMRLGRPTLAEDISRVEAMRNHLPDEIEMMADANEA
ncbi:MAG: enolase C-terminal domain-like protein, partial [Geminicoccaceae bacterium]